ncbi:MAG: type VII toxin-antitoxin system HepT family RNase toxin [Candidatus Helarchaeota archaeon]
MLDEDIILDRLAKLENYLIELRAIRNLEYENFINLRNFMATQHLLQLAIQICIDIGNHIVSVKKFKKPEAYFEIFEILNKEKLISDKNAKKFIKMAKFRNVLVHFYPEVDEKQIYQFVQDNLDDFNDFIKEISKILKNQ